MAKERGRDYASKLGLFHKFTAAEKKYGLPDGMLAALAQAESDFDKDVISGKRKSRVGATGLMQFMPATAKELGVDPLNVDSSIDGAGKYLKQLYSQTGSWNGALSSYNWGIGNYKKYINGKKKSMPKETRDYTSKILANTKNFGTGMKEEAPTYEPNVATTGDLLPSAALPARKPQPTVTGSPVKTPDVSQEVDLFNKPPTSILPIEQDQSVDISTGAGNFNVVPENAEEKELFGHLKDSNSLGLIQHLPELLGSRDAIRKGKKLIPTRNDSFDKLLGELVDSV